MSPTRWMPTGDNNLTPAYASEYVFSPPLPEGMATGELYQVILESPVGEVAEDYGTHTLLLD